MRKYKLLITLLVLIGVIFISSFVIKRETNPSPDTRIILEHTYQTYIAPRCFQQSNPTNYLQDSTLEEANRLQYPPHDSCTEQEMKGEKDFLFISLLKEIGVLSKKWDNW